MHQKLFIQELKENLKQGVKKGIFLFASTKINICIEYNLKLCVIKIANSKRSLFIIQV